MFRISEMTMVVILLLLLVGCDREQAPMTGIRVAVSQTPLSSAFFIASRNQYFERCGIKPDLIPVNGGKRAFQTMLDGEADFSTSSDSVASFSVLQRKTFNILASFATSENDVKLISNTPEMPAARKVRLGYWAGTASEHLLKTVLSLYYPELDYEPVSLPQEQLLTQFRRQRLDMISVWEPYGWQLYDQLQSGQAYLLDTKALLSLHFMLLSKNTDEKTREATNRLLAALQLAINFLHQQPEQAKSIVYKHMQAEATFINWVWDDYLFQLKNATSIKSALLSNSRWLSNSEPLDYTLYLDQAKQLGPMDELIERWC